MRRVSFFRAGPLQWQIRDVFLPVLHRPQTGTQNRGQQISFLHRRKRDHQRMRIGQRNTHEVSAEKRGLGDILSGIQSVYIAARSQSLNIPYHSNPSKLPEGIVVCEPFIRACWCLEKILCRHSNHSHSFPILNKNDPNLVINSGSI